MLATNWLEAPYQILSYFREPFRTDLRTFTYIFLSFLLSANVFGQQMDVLFNRLTYRGIEHKANNLSEHTHTGLKPLIESKVNTSTALGYVEDSAKYYYRFTRLMFGGHLVDIKGEDYRIIVDPQFNFTRARELKKSDPQIDTSRYYTNTRGFSIGGDLGKHISFQTRFYENLSGEPIYLRNWIDRRRAFPQQGRPKSFRSRSFDYAWATGKVSWSPSDKVNFQFGNDRHFVGHGYRSMLLSDNSFIYPYVKGSVWLLKDKIQYSTIFAKLQSFARLPTGQSSESLFYWKRATFHHLSLDLGRIQLALFEATHWQTIGEDGVKPLDPMEWNPVIGINSLSNGFDAANKQLLGIDLRVKASDDLMIYGQLATDAPDEGRTGRQFGMRWFNAGLAGLDLQLEYNSADPYLYTGLNGPMAHTHFGAEMAHPLGADFTEFVGILDFRSGKWLASAKLNLATINRDSLETDNYGNDLFKPAMEQNRVGGTFQQELVFFEGHVSYLLNQHYNMMLSIGIRYRDLSNAPQSESSTYPYLSLHTSLFNRYYDF